jgi:ankyrin repeat protein
MPGLMNVSRSWRTLHWRGSLWAKLLAAPLILVIACAGCSERPHPTINLYRAIQAGDLDQIKRHLFWGTDVNQPDPEGDLPLHVAARRGRVVIVRELMDHGAEVNAKNRLGQTPLYVALSHGKTQVAQVLEDAGASDEPQQLLFGLVEAKVTDRDSLAFLIQRGADINGRNAAGEAPLHSAAASGSVLLVKRLIDEGADVNRLDAQGRTPLTIAERHNDPDVIALLRRFGARSSASSPQQ